MVSKHSLALGLGTPSKSCAASFSRAALAGHRSRTVHCRRALLADSLLPQSLAREQPACRGRTLAEPIRGQKRIKKNRKTLVFFFEKNAERCRKYPRVSASFALISSPLEEKRAGRQQRKKQQKKLASAREGGREQGPATNLRETFPAQTLLTGRCRTVYRNRNRLREKDCAKARACVARGKMMHGAAAGRTLSHNGTHAYRAQRLQLQRRQMNGRAGQRRRRDTYSKNIITPGHPLPL